jgi:hypothetical protein
VNRTTLTIVLGALLACTLAKVVYTEWVPGPLDRIGILRASDFQIFYFGGMMIAQGDAARLYEHRHLQELQLSLAPLDDERNPPGFLFYPPMAPLLVSPLARVPYQPAVAVWWFLQAICFLAAGWLLRAEMHIEAAWRPTVWLALMAFYPIWDTVLHGQLSAVLLLVVVAAFHLQRRRHVLWAGLVLSLLAMKPQFFVGAFVWLLLRRDWRSVAAMASGLVLQLAVVAAMLGPSVLAAYVGDWPVCAKISLIYHLAPWAQHGLGITVQNLLTALGCAEAASHRAGMLLQLLVASAAGVLLWRAIAMSKRNRATQPDEERSFADQHFVPVPVRMTETSLRTAEASLANEQTCAVLFMLLVTPHVLLYDLSLLVVPLVNLWSSSRWRLGVALYAVTSVFAIPVYDAVGFSIVPVVLLVTLFRLTCAGTTAGGVEWDQKRTAGQA